MSDGWSLPPGLNPVTAGRWGLWLLSKRQYRAAKRRRAFAEKRVSRDEDSHGRRFIRLIVPWQPHEYPGALRFIAAVLGVEVSSARRYLAPSMGLPRVHAAVLAGYLEGHAALCLALARELREVERSKPLVGRARARGREVTRDRAIRYASGLEGRQRAR